MARFKFSMESVLAYKESLVESLQLELAILEQQAEQARIVRDGLKTEIEQGGADLRELVGQGPLDVNAVFQHQGYLQRLGDRLEQQQAVVAELEAQAARKREELLEMQREREVLQELKERQWQRFRRELEQAEARLIDESAIAGFNRRRMARNS